jgi:LemA protein
VSAGWIVLALGVVVIAGLAWAYNRLVKMRNLVATAWADVDVQLRRRADLVPALVEVVGGYASHEREALTAVAEARTRALSAPSEVAAREQAEDALRAATGRLVLLAEAYPDLKADARFRDLQAQLVAVENDLASARRYYNAVVRDNNALVLSFPVGVLGRATGFHTAEFFEAGDGRAMPEVGFDAAA